MLLDSYGVGIFSILNINVIFLSLQIQYNFKAENLLLSFISIFVEFLNIYVHKRNRFRIQCSSMNC